MLGFERLRIYNTIQTKYIYPIDSISMANQEKINAVYVVKPEFILKLSEELESVLDIRDDLVFSSSLKKHVCFAQDIWLDPKIITFQSISEATKLLRQAGKLWYLHPINQIRRSKLIEEKLRKCPPLTRNFPIEIEIPPIGAFGLLDQNTLIYNVKRFKKWPQGKCYFIEDKINPPNRAYLKLWEALTVLGKYPTLGQSALDLGASPGGWTWVLQSLGATVTAVDKAPLDPIIAKLPNVHFLQQSAFALDPNTLEKTYDWVCSDIICYPDKAYNLIMKWIASGKAKQMIFTIKLQGEIDLEKLKPFQTIPNSRLLNLFHNKHEATFFYPAFPIDSIE